MSSAHTKAIRKQIAAEYQVEYEHGADSIIEVGILLYLEKLAKAAHDNTRANPSDSQRVRINLADARRAIQSVLSDVKMT